jgi:hypothetical protein
VSGRRCWSKLHAARSSGSSQPCWPGEKLRWILVLLHFCMFSCLGASRVLMVLQLGWLQQVCLFR